MSFKETVKKLWFSLNGKKRLVLLDYPVNPARLYDENKNTPHRGLYNNINTDRTAFKELLKQAIKYKEKIFEITQDKELDNDIDPGWNNEHLPGLDIIMLYTILAEIKPKKFVEIGSGTSTRVAYKTKKDNDLSFTITSIDPLPRKNISQIVTTAEKKEVQKVTLDYFSELNAGDILFFDGTHTLYPNTDVMWFFLEVLPILKKGVCVQLHDIYLPYDYPQFMCNRYYNEQYILAACLLNNPAKYKIICPNFFIYTEKELLDILNPFWEHPKFSNTEKHGGSFWFKIAN